MSEKPSELKGCDAAFDPGDAAGRTMMAFDVEDELLPPAPAAVPQAPQVRLRAAR